MLKANEEYTKYKRKTIDELSPVERDYLASLKDTQKKMEHVSKVKAAGTDKQ
jgi:hypothetical protein